MSLESLDRRNDQPLAKGPSPALFKLDPPHLDISYKQEITSQDDSEARGPLGWRATA